MIDGLALDAIARQIDGAPDAEAYMGLQVLKGGDPAVYSRHGIQADGCSSAIHATSDRDRCTCLAAGARCVLAMTAEDLLCPACRVACNH